MKLHCEVCVLFAEFSSGQRQNQSCSIKQPLCIPSARTRPHPYNVCRRGERLRPIRFDIVLVTSLTLPFLDSVYLNSVLLLRLFASERLCTQTRSTLAAESKWRSFVTKTTTTQRHKHVTSCLVIIAFLKHSCQI